jgi:hypothetical protein
MCTACFAQRVRVNGEWRGTWSVTHGFFVVLPPCQLPDATRLALSYRKPSWAWHQALFGLSRGAAKRS